AATTALQVVTELRAAGYRSDMDYLNRSFKAQFKTVDRKKAKVAIMIGETEVQNGTVNMKEIETQEKLTVALDAVVDTMDAMFHETEDAHVCTCGEEHCTCNHEE
ncbi:MAG: His/Gly/Thr/Pro-type tRNA ligase C-terminal domain-containing protein, partial [Clostridium sp.]